MGFLNFLAGRQYRGKINNTKIPRWSIPPERNTAEWISAFGKNPRLAVVNKIASDLSYVEGKLYEVDKNGEEKELKSHPFLDFWNSPNPLFEFTSNAIWKLQEIYLLLKGEGYFIIERGMDGIPAELWPVPTHWVMETPYLNHPFYRVQMSNANSIQVSVDDMFVMKTLNPLDPFRRGLGQSEAIADEIEIDEYAAKFQKKFFYNDATPSLLVGMPGSQKEERDRFVEMWKNKFMGVNNSHKVAAIGANVSVNKLADNMKDLDMVNGRLFVRDSVLEHFGVPREIMGITENSNRATAEASQYIYAKNVLTPRLSDREKAVNAQLIPYFGTNLVWRYDDIIPHDKEFEKGVAVEGWNNGLLTKNEAREKLSMSEERAGNIYKIQYTDIYMGSGEDLTDLMGGTGMHMGEQESEIEVTEQGSGEDNTEIEISEEKILRMAEEIKQKKSMAARQSLERARMEQGRKFEAAAARFFSSQAKQVKKALEGSSKDSGDIWESLGMTEEEFNALPEPERERLVEEFTKNLLDWEAQEDILFDMFYPLWTETYEKGTEGVKTVYRLNQIQQPALVDVERIRGGERIKGITKTTRESIRNIIVDGLETGKGRRELTEAIMQSMNTNSVRAKTIAAQECNISLSAGNFDMAAKGGFAKKTWNVTEPSKARDTHRGLNGKTIGFNEAFVTSKGNRLMMPLDPDCNVAEETVNCHCYLIYS